MRQKFRNYKNYITDEKVEIIGSARTFEFVEYTIRRVWIVRNNERQDE